MRKVVKAVKVRDLVSPSGTAAERAAVSLAQVSPLSEDEIWDQVPSLGVLAEKTMVPGIIWAAKPPTRGHRAS